MNSHLILVVMIMSIALATNGAISETSQKDSSQSLVTIAPRGLLFRPLLANTYEPRVGILSQIGKNGLRLDIGNSIDLLRIQGNREGSIWAIGADFFTFTLLRGEKDFHFPVDASDYFFGINATWRKTSTTGEWTSRLRVSHVSAHFVDGHYDNTQGLWKDGRFPIVYSREFIDWVVAYEPASLLPLLRVYVGGTYLFHVDPKDLSRLMSSVGIEYHSEVLKTANLYGSYQATVLKISSLGVRHNIQLGCKWGEMDGPGLKTYVSYFSGYSIHGEYFDVLENYFAVGFLLDF